MTGIYAIENIINTKKYIGQSSNIETRWLHHKSDLNNNRHHNKHLQSSWNKYKEDNFIFYVIEECDLDELDSKEVYWIEYYDTYNNGYNLDLGGKGCRGYKHTEEEINKMREIQNPKHVIQCDKEGNYIKEWFGVSHISKELGYSKRNIECCCNKVHGHKSAYNYLWFYKSDYENNNIDWNYYLDKKQKINDIGKRVQIIDINTEQSFIYNSISQVARVLGTSRQSVYSCLDNKGNLKEKYRMCYL